MDLLRNEIHFLVAFPARVGDVIADVGSVHAAVSIEENYRISVHQQNLQQMIVA